MMHLECTGIKMLDGNKCPHCGEELKGTPGRRVCKNMHYEVDVNDPNSYDKPLAKQERIKRMAE